MLVLTRRTGERIKIGDDVWVTVLRTGAGRVKLGIDAPRDVDVVREECSGGPANLAKLPRDLKNSDSFDVEMLLA